LSRYEKYREAWDYMRNPESNDMRNPELNEDTK